MLPKIAKGTAKKIIEEQRLEQTYKDGYENGRQHGYEAGFAAAKKVAEADIERLQQEYKIKIQRAEAVIAIARAITHL